MVEQEPPPIEWRIDGLAVDGALTMLAGREGEGKSLLALALASAVTRGAEAAGFLCKPGRALIVDVENGEHEAHRRVHGLRPDPEKLAYCIGPLDLSRDLDLLADLLHRVGPDLLVLDSLRPLIPGTDENDSRIDTALAPLRDLVRAHDTACVLLHHAGKQGGEYRGSTAIGAAVELGFTLASARDADPRRCLTCWKSRLSARLPDRWLEIRKRPDGLPEIAPAEQPPAPADASREHLVGEIVAALASGPHRRADLAELVREPRSQPSGAFQRALDLAVQRNLIVKPKRGVYALAAGAAQERLP